MAVCWRSTKVSSRHRLIRKLTRTTWTANGRSGRAPPPTASGSTSSALTSSDTAHAGDWDKRVVIFDDLLASHFSGTILWSSATAAVQVRHSSEGTAAGTSRPNLCPPATGCTWGSKQTTPWPTTALGSPTRLASAQLFLLKRNWKYKSCFALLFSLRRHILHAERNPDLSLLPEQLPGQQGMHLRHLAGPRHLRQPQLSQLWHRGILQLHLRFPRNQGIFVFSSFDFYFLIHFPVAVVVRNMAISTIVTSHKTRVKSLLENLLEFVHQRWRHGGFSPTRKILRRRHPDPSADAEHPQLRLDKVRGHPLRVKHAIHPYSCPWCYIMLYDS